MQTYEPILKRLTESQKIRLLTNFSSLADSEMTNLGVPRVSGAPLQSANDGRFPSPAALARSWNPALVAEVAACYGTLLMQKGYNYAILPPAKGAVGMMADSLSEDPCLSGEMAGAFLQGISDVGLRGWMEGYGYQRRSADAMWTGKKPTPRVLREQMVAPYATALSKGPCLGIVAEGALRPAPDLLDAPGEGSELSNRYKAEDGTGLRTIRSRVDDAGTVRAIERGDLILEGSAVSLQSALHTYRRLRSGIEHGKATTGELNTALASGEAIVETLIDESLTKLFAFAESCATPETVPAKSAEEIHDLAERAIRASTVLLENRSHILPLTLCSRVCLIGDAARAEGEGEGIRDLLRSKGHSFTGFARGYDMAAERSDDLLQEAEAMAKRADVVILFLSSERRQAIRRTVLGANQLALFDRLGRMKKRMIVVMSSDTPPDMSFLDRAFTPPMAVLLAPLHVVGGVRHVMETILGMCAPEGRLTSTFADRDDPAGDRHRLKEGPFLGYRFYDTVGAGARYVFGHGLTYTKFRYSSLKVQNGTVTFTIGNAGKRTGVAVPQVYLGMKGSSILRPLKELIGFTSVSLAPGNTATISIPLTPLAVTDAEGHRLPPEAGKYTVYVGESVSDIRLTQSITLAGESIAADGESPADYLPSVTNIFKDHYTLEAEYTSMKPSLRNPLFGIAALLMAVCVKVFDIMSGTRSIYLDILAGILAIGSIVFLVMEIVDRKHHVVREQKRLEEINSILYADAKQIPAPSADELFADAYDPNCNDEFEMQVTEVAAPTIADGVDYFADVDPSMTFATIAKEFARLATEKGLTMEESVARSIFASLATSRLIVVKDMDNKRFASLLNILCEYLDCPACLDTVDASYVNETAVLFNGSEERNALKAITSAQNRPRNIHLAALTDVTWAGLSAYFVPYAGYARSPYSAANVMVQDADRRNISYRIPENLWFIINLKDKETLPKIPDYVADMAAVVSWKVTASKPASGACSEFRQFYYGQMLYLCDRIKSSFVMDEEAWKKIDRVEAFAARHTEFHIGNKQWIGMETYLAVLASCEVDVPLALDEAMAVKLLPALIAALSGKLARDERGLGETLDIIFGDSNTLGCRKVIKESGADLI